MTTDTPNTVTGTDVGGDVEKLLAEIEARANAATDGPWEELGTPHDDDGLVTVFSMHDEENDPIAMASDLDADFIAHAREDIPTLIGLARTLQQRIDNALAAMEQFVDSDRFTTIRAALTATDSRRIKLQKPDGTYKTADEIRVEAVALTATETSGQ